MIFVKNIKLIFLGLLGFTLLLVFANSQLSNKQSSQSQNKPSESQKTNYKNITSQELKEMLTNKDFYFINVHIPYEGEIEKTDAFIPYNEIEKNLDKLPKNKNSKIVLYCRTGRMSAIAAQKLIELGYTNVYNHLFGMHDWQIKGYRLIINENQ